jgi:hypothetical protein
LFQTEFRCTTNTNLFNPMKRTTCLFVFLFLLCKLFAHSPGGIAKPDIWLKGNFSADSNRLALINYNAAIALDKGDAKIKLNENIEKLQQVTVFTVYCDSVTDKQKNIWQLTGEFGDLSISPDNVASESENLNVPVQKHQLLASHPKTETFLHSYSGTFIQGASSNNNSESTINFGNSAAIQSADGSLKSVAELIIYKKLLNEKEMARVESYLALKYGVSLEQNYLNAKGEKIWNWDKQKRFSHNIAGIGRDDRSALYQKQSRSSTSIENLTIGINKIVFSNALNTGTISNGDHLIWGDNGDAFTAPNSFAPADEFLFSDKKWLITTTGQSSNKISTEIKINTKTFLPGKLPAKNFYLVIDRSASGFKSEKFEYITADDISADGVATFKNVLWDIDGSGKDNFTFAYKPNLLSELKTIAPDSANGNSNSAHSALKSFSAFPNPVTNGICQVDILLDNPTDFVVNLYDLSHHLINSRSVTGQQSYQFTEHMNGKPGTYIFQLITPKEEYYRIIIIQ